MGPLSNQWKSINDALYQFSSASWIRILSGSPGPVSAILFAYTQTDGFETAFDCQKRGRYLYASSTISSRRARARTPLAVCHQKASHPNCLRISAMPTLEKTNRSATLTALPRRADRSHPLRSPRFSAFETALCFRSVTRAMSAALAQGRRHRHR